MRVFHNQCFMYWMKVPSVPASNGIFSLHICGLLNDGLGMIGEIPVIYFVAQRFDGAIAHR